MIDREQLEEEFFGKVRERIAAGASEYGDTSFHKPPIESAQEILEEVEDIAGWAFVMWVSLRMRMGRVLKAEAAKP